MKPVENAKYDEDKRVFLTCFNNQSNETFEVLTYCKMDLTSNDRGVKCRMIDRNVLKRV